MGMDHCDDDVIIAFVFYLLAEEEKEKKRKYWIHSVSSKRREGEFPTLFGHR